MSDGGIEDYYALSSSSLPGDLKLEVTHSFDFSIPASQASYNYFQYNFTSSDGATAHAKVYLDELRFPEDLQRPVPLHVSEDISASGAASEFLSSALLTMAALGWDAVYYDPSFNEVSLADELGEAEYEDRLLAWMSAMNEMKS